MTNKNKFKIGDWVKSKHYSEIVYEGNKRCLFIYSKSEEFVGQICGAVYRKVGKKTLGTSSTIGLFAFEEYDPPYFDVEKTYFLYQIRIGFTNKPIEVLEKHIEKVDSEGRILPFRYCKVYRWTENDKKNLREEMKNFPRDKKGRWIKP
jgi:hypothetical protein